MYAYMCVHVRVSESVCMCVRVCVISGFSILFKIFAKPINLHSLYTCEMALIYFM